MSTLTERKIDTRVHRLHVVHGPRSDKPMVLFLHGYPDSHRVWREIMQTLDSVYFVVSFDMRGVAESKPPAVPALYHIGSMIEDIHDLIAALGRKSAHLVGHDWGSVIGWSFLTHPAYKAMVDSWTSISGPHLGIWRQWLLANLTSLNVQRTMIAVRQLLKSSYVPCLLAWPIPEIVWRVGGVPLWRWILKRGGVPHDDPILHESREHVLSMTLRPMQLYRRNILRPPPEPLKDSVHCPVQLIIATRDPFLSEETCSNLGNYVSDLTLRRVDASHWAPRSHPEEITRCIRDFIAATTSSPAPGC